MRSGPPSSGEMSHLIWRTPVFRVDRPSRCRCADAPKVCRRIPGSRRGPSTTLVRRQQRRQSNRMPAHASDHRPSHRRFRYRRAVPWQRAAPHRCRAREQPRPPRIRCNRHTKPCSRIGRCDGPRKRRRARARVRRSSEPSSVPRRGPQEAPSVSRQRLERPANATPAKTARVRGARALERSRQPFAQHQRAGLRAPAWRGLLPQPRRR